MSKRELVPFDRLRAQNRGTRDYASPNPNVPLRLTPTLLGRRATGLIKSGERRLGGRNNPRCLKPCTAQPQTCRRG